jgi:CheY-like chemotaxis protein
MLRILIVEDENMVALDLKDMVTAIVPAVVVVTASVASTEKALHEPFDLAFLDVNVTDGNTYGIARQLREKRVPYVFVSGSSLDRLPSELRTSRFITKPYRREQIERALLAPDVQYPGAIRS